jgi:hypothetical protein
MAESSARSINRPLNGRESTGTVKYRMVSDGIPYAQVSAGDAAYRDERGRISKGTGAVQ